MFGAVKLTKNFDFYKYRYSGYGIGFDVDGTILLPNSMEFGRNVIIFGVYVSSFVQTDSKILRKA